MSLSATCAADKIDLRRLQSPGECIFGNCSNGYGTLRYPDGSEVTGNRVDDHTVAGSYEIRWSCRPDKVFSITLDNAGHYVEGTAVRCGGLLAMLGSGGRPTYYTGTWMTTSNPFIQEQISTYKTGTYTDANGVKWEGEFDYIPVLKSYDDAQWGKTAILKGSFIFMGAKIDTQFDEVMHGLFISEPTVPGEEIHLFRARPDYLVKLRSTYVTDRMQDASEREADARASRELFSNIVTFASVAVVAYGTYKIAAASSERATMDSLNGVLTGQKSPSEVNASLPYGQNNSASKSSSSITVAEYQNQKTQLQMQREAASRQQAQQTVATHARADAKRSARANTTASSVMLSSSTSSSTDGSAQKYGTSRTKLPHEPYADPNPYENYGAEKDRWGFHSSGNGQTRDAACSVARKKSQEEIGRHSANWRFDAISPCICKVNFAMDRSILDAMAETGEPDQWFCALYEKKTQIRNLGSSSR